MHLCRLETCCHLSMMAASADEALARAADGNCRAIQLPFRNPGALWLSFSVFWLGCNFFLLILFLVNNLMWCFSVEGHRLPVEIDTIMTAFLLSATLFLAFAFCFYHTATGGTQSVIRPNFMRGASLKVINFQNCQSDVMRMWENILSLWQKSPSTCNPKIYLQTNCNYWL